MMMVSCRTREVKNKSLERGVGKKTRGNDIFYFRDNKIEVTAKWQNASYLIPELVSNI